MCRALPTGDYSVEGMEGVLAVERKSLADLVGSLVQRRTPVLRACERLAGYQWRAILIEASYQDVKSPYSAALGVEVEAHPNSISGSLDAIEAEWGIPIIYTSRNRDLAEECLASWLSKTFTYWWLERNKLGRVLQEGDL